ncbi:type II secretion system protein [Chitinimonas koreensis]|uniref:type II secretion system protein n=1 Tax=Chitinimonas koreensis TaxID=356302 RepID=UPI000418F817|nr:type II secretion system protein [Chitinimonas koreensis]QNM94827.1 type II secretion system protein [Chitinimonas koreensis]
MAQPARRRQAGFTYLVAIFVAALLALLSGHALEQVQTAERREREAELLFVGEAFRSAIGEYYQRSPGTEKHYPPTLEALLVDDRLTRLRRPLRRIYRDPLTAEANWGLVAAPDGGIMGVYSQAPGQPLKVDHFAPAQADFTGASRYQDWRFVFTPTDPGATRP